MSKLKPTHRIPRQVPTLFCLLFLSIPFAATAQWYVDSAGVTGASCTANDPCPLIADAVAVAAPGDTINVAAGPYTESGINVPIPLNIVGAGALATTIDGAGAGPVFNIMTPGNSSVEIRGLTIQNGDAGIADGGAISLQSGNLTVFGARLIHNLATFGGAIAHASNGELLVSGTLIQGNISTDSGGGISCDNCGGVTVLASFVADNFAGSDGGGIHTRFSSVEVWASNISRNEADQGGGIFAYLSSVRVLDSGVSFNDAVVGNGGGFSVVGNLDVERSAITKNTTSASGGALSMSGPSSLTMGNTTISGNAATCGGGLALGGGTTAIVGTATFYGNSSSSGGCAQQIQSGGAVAMGLYNSIVTAAAGTQCSGPLAAGNYNLIDDATCDTGLATFNQGVVTLIDPNLAFNGGLSRTHAINSQSNAVDAGYNPACLNPGTGAPLVVDQRGQTRPFNGTCDIGAYEWQP